MFVTDSKNSYAVMPAELKMVYFIVVYNCPIAIVDHFGSLGLSQFADLMTAQKFECSRAKTTSI